MATIYGRIQDAGSATKARGMSILDSQIPPERRSEHYQNIQSWANANPKLAAFLVAQIALSGPPLLAFTLFSVTVFSTALIVCVLTGLFIALTFTFFCVTAAVLILLPTLFLTGLTASFFYFWGLVAFLLAQWFNNDPRTEGIRTQAYETARNVSSKANDLSDGRLELAMADSKDREKALDVARASSIEKTNAAAAAAREYRVATAGEMGARDVKSGRVTSGAGSNGVQRIYMETSGSPPGIVTSRHGL